MGYSNDWLNHGFVRNPDGTLTTFEAPGASTKPHLGNWAGTYALSINAAGAVTGYYLNDSRLYHGYARSPSGAFTTFKVPGADETYGWGINAAGVIVGYYSGNNLMSYGFVRTP